jgi:catechol 2,3-dioxygenase-like lactoylglutathione lyase family enzyme
MLNERPVIGFIPTKDFARARTFYVDWLGLEELSVDAFALFVKASSISIRIFLAGEFTPAPYTILGWTVTDIAKAIEELAGRGIAFEHYAYLEQDASGVWTSPEGARVAWFKDLDGNTLSISQV